MLVEAGIVGLLTLAAWRAMAPQKGIMTPEMRKIYHHALNKNDPPVTANALLDLAAIFDRLALPAYSEELRKRAAIRARPQAVKDAHKAAYRKAKSSKDPNNVRMAAAAFTSQGMTNIAADLYNYAAALDAAQLAAPLTGPTSGAAASASGPYPTPGGFAAPSGYSSPDSPGNPSPAYTSAAPEDGAPGSLVPSIAEQDPTRSGGFDGSGQGGAISDAAGGSAIATAEYGVASSTGTMGEDDGFNQDKDFREFTEFGGPSGLIAPAAGTAAKSGTDGSGGEGGPVIAPDSTSTTAPVDSVAAGLGMTDEQYAAFQNGTLMDDSQTTTQ